MKRPRNGFSHAKLYASFTPDGPSKDDQKEFLLTWVEVRNKINRYHAKKLSIEIREQAKFQEAFDKLLPFMTAFLSDDEKSSITSDDLVKLVPDKEMRRKVCEYFVALCNDPPTSEVQDEEAHNQKKTALQNSGRLLRSVEKIQNGLASLWSAALEGDEEASRHLIEVTNFACGMVGSAEKKHPLVFGKIAQSATRWPCVAKSEHGWEVVELKRLEKLKLGSSLRVFQPKFRRAQGSDKNLPARRWAKAAVRTVEETRLRQFVYGIMAKDFESSEDFADFMMKVGWLPGTPDEEPGWVDEARVIPPFSRETLPQWKNLVRQVIRDQMSDFHTHQDWRTQRNTAKESGRDTRGDIQNAILDDIVSALGKVAPET